MADLPSRLMNVEQVAEWLQVKPRTIYQWVHEGYIPVVKLGVLVRFREACCRRSESVQFPPVNRVQ